MKDYSIVFRIHLRSQKITTSFHQEILGSLEKLIYDGIFDPALLAAIHKESVNGYVESSRNQYNIPQVLGKIILPLMLMFTSLAMSMLLVVEVVSLTCHVAWLPSGKLT